MGALQALRNIMKAILVPIGQVRLVWASTALARDLVDVFGVILIYINIFCIQVYQAQCLELFINLIHVFLEPVDVASLSRSAWIDRELRFR